MSPTMSYQIKSEGNCRRSRQKPGLKLAQKRDGVGPESLHVVSRHQRNRADVEIARACAGDLESAVVGVGLRGEAERELLVLIGKRGKAKWSAGRWRPCPRSARPLPWLPGCREDKFGPYTACPSPERGPTAGCRAGVEAIQLDARALVADKRLVLVHHHDFIGTHRTPFAKLHVAERAALRPSRGSGSLDEIGK